MLVSSAWAVLACGSLPTGAWGGGGAGKVAAIVCIMLCIRWLDCWSSIAMALIML